MEPKTIFFSRFVCLSKPKLLKLSFCKMNFIWGVSNVFCENFCQPKNFSQIENIIDLKTKVSASNALLWVRIEWQNSNKIQIQCCCEEVCHNRVWTQPQRYLPGWERGEEKIHIHMQVITLLLFLRRMRLKAASYCSHWTNLPSYKPGWKEIHRKQDVGRKRMGKPGSPPLSDI